MTRLACAALGLALATVARADGRSLSAADLDAFARLQDARALAEARRGQPGGAARRAPLEAEWKQQVAAAGWTVERYQEVEGLVGDVQGFFQAEKDDPASAASYWEGVEKVDAATVALVRGRRAQLDGAEERARAALRAEQEAGALGRLASRADLQGTWRRDAAATGAHLQKALKLDEAQVRKLLAETAFESTLAFAGDQVESSQVKGGKAEAWKGSWRLAGRDLLFRLPSGREEKLQVGLLPSGELVLSAFGVPSGVYRKR